MRNLFAVGLLFLACAGIPSNIFAQSSSPSSRLNGAVTDPSGAVIPGVNVQLRGPKGKQTQVTDAGGQYSFQALTPGKYDVQVTAPDFKVEQRQAFDVSGVTVLNFQLTLQSQSQVITRKQCPASNDPVDLPCDADSAAIFFQCRNRQADQQSPETQRGRCQRAAGFTSSGSAPSTPDCRARICFLTETARCAYRPNPAGL
jgi:hypothetical protein